MFVKWVNAVYFLAKYLGDKKVKEAESYEALQDKQNGSSNGKKQAYTVDQ